MWSGAVLQLFAQIGLQSDGASGLLRSIYAVLRVTMFDPAGFLHPACFEQSSPFAAELVQFELAVGCSVVYFALLFAHAVLEQRSRRLSSLLVTPVNGS